MIEKTQNKKVHIFDVDDRDNKNNKNNKNNNNNNKMELIDAKLRFEIIKSLSAGADSRSFQSVLR